MHLLSKHPDGAFAAFAHPGCVGRFAHAVQGVGDYVKGQVLVRLKKARHDRSDNGLDIFGGGVINHMTSVRKVDKYTV
ncbi:hypothetical protein [Pantoea sp. A4]|uniref:hypothetical protein n=1 Tax=Pantoea sp. A4 TaxID=1225184 RepID=UPI00037529E6|nr:hypothetical protein [Pantoea sp. A4]